MNGDAIRVINDSDDTAPFEAIKQVNVHGAEYWSARDVQPLLGYAKWASFHAAVKKAMKSCEASGNVPEHHFAGASKMIAVGKGGQRETADYHLSRFACYLIAQNGDPRKVEVATAQKYFAIQTRRMELSDQQAADMERLELRQQAKESFKALSGAARKSGVQNAMFGIFRDAGYRGMYGCGVDRIREIKGIGSNEQLLDRAGATELAANNFRMTQTTDKLARENVRDQQVAIRTHEEVGREVRKAIQQIGGTLPEAEPAAEHIRIVEKRVKKSKPKIALTQEHATGLLPPPLTADDL